MPAPSHPDIDRAKADAMAARARLTATMSELQKRLTPRALLQDAWEEVSERSTALADVAVGKMRQRPLATAGIVAAVALFLVRKPLFMALMQRFRPDDETASPADGSASAKALPRRRRASPEDRS